LQHLPSFYRGLFTTTEIARRLAPGCDALGEAIQDLRLIASLTQFREMAGGRQFPGLMDKYAALLMELPDRIDKAPTLVADGSARLRLHVPETAEHRRQKNSLAIGIALLAVLAAVGLLSHHVASAAGGTWAGKLDTFLFVLFGAMLLWAVSRIR